MIILSTDRLLIRQITLEDINDTIEHRLDPEVCRYISKPMTIKEIVEFVDKHSKQWQGKLNEHLALGVILKSEKKLIGELKLQTLDLNQKVIEIGFRFNKHYHRKGYAFEASIALLKYVFNEMEMNKVVGICFEQNIASCRLMEKLGMRLDSSKNEMAILEGIEMRMLEYFIDKSFWQSNNERTKVI